MARGVRGVPSAREERHQHARHAGYARPVREVRVSAVREHAAPARRCGRGDGGPRFRSLVGRPPDPGAGAFLQARTAADPGEAPGRRVTAVHVLKSGRKRRRIGGAEETRSRPRGVWRRLSRHPRRSARPRCRVHLEAEPEAAGRRQPSICASLGSMSRRKILPAKARLHGHPEDEVHAVESASSAACGRAGIEHDAVLAAQFADARQHGAGCPGVRRER